MIAHRALFMCSAVLLIACEGREQSSASASADGGTTAGRTDVEIAAEVARAIDASPSKADSILSAHDLTIAALDSLMYEIAADSGKAARYESLRNQR